jgi:hypothetical protein
LFLDTSSRSIAYPSLPFKQPQASLAISQVEKDQDERGSSKPEAESGSRVSAGQKRRHALLPKQSVVPARGRFGHEEGEKDE